MEKSFSEWCEFPLQSHKNTMLEPGCCCSCGTLQWQWVVLCKHLARQVLDIYLLQKQWRFAGKRQQEGRPMSILMRHDRQADSVVCSSALVAFLFPVPFSLSHLLCSGEVTDPLLWHVECICHRTKRQSVQPSTPMWMHFSSCCHRY